MPELSPTRPGATVRSAPAAAGLAAPAGPADTSEEVLQGIGVSAGSVLGPVLRMRRPPAPPPARSIPPAEADQEIGLAAAALEAVATDLSDRAAVLSDPAAREVLAAQAMIAADPVLLDGVAGRINAGVDAAHAVRSTLDEYRDLLATAGGYLAERTADLDDIAHRVVAAVLGAPMPGLPASDRPYVLVADDLAPADTAALDPARVLALVTERGGPTSHTAILARSLGLPAVVGCRAASRLREGDLVAVDGATGSVRRGGGPAANDPPGPDGQAHHDDPAGRPTVPVRGGPVSPSAGPAVPSAGSADSPAGRTADGHQVDLLLNIGSAADLSGVDLAGTAGVGLFRTEFLFLDRRVEPGFDEQVAAYSAVFAAMSGEDGGHRHIVVRTLDAGADKPLPFLGLPDEPNPALGVRGFRTARVRPDVLDTQLRAIAAAAARTPSGPAVWVMAPMVSTPGEAAEFAARARAAGLETAGVMIEVPAAALRADRFLQVADFLSIGTNDLGQYALAADRQCGDLPDLLDPWQPALLELVGGCARAGTRAGRPVSVCGEAAADPLLAPVLVGLGVSGLSVAPRALPAVRAALTRTTLPECRQLAQAALDADDAAGARAAIRAAVRER